MNKESLVNKINELKDIIKNILLKKNISDEEKKYAKECANNLVNLTNNNDPKALVLLGKINTRLNNYDEAILNFNDAVNINPLLASPYYGLFKINIEQGNYAKALYNIELYGLYSGIDINVYINLLNVLLGITPKPINTVDNVFGNYKLYEPIITNYNLAISYINVREYESTLKHIKACIKLINRYNYHIDLSSLEKILDKLVLKEKELRRESEIKNFIQLYFNENNLGANYLYLKKLLSYDPTNINVLILLIECSILLSDYNGAQSYLDKARAIDNKYSKRLDYLDNKLKCINKSSKDNIKDIKINSEIDKLVQNKDIEASINLCTRYFEQLNDPYYLYYAGKILYVNNDIKGALTFLKRYISIGQAHIKEAYYYLFFIYYKLNDILLADHYASLILELSQYEDIEFGFEELKDYLLFYINHFNDQSMFELEKMLLKKYVIENNEIKIEKVRILKNNNKNVN